MQLLISRGVDVNATGPKAKPHWIRTAAAPPADLLLKSGAKDRRRHPPRVVPAATIREALGVPLLQRNDVLSIKKSAASRSQQHVDGDDVGRARELVVDEKRPQPGEGDRCLCGELERASPAGHGHTGRRRYDQLHPVGLAVSVIQRMKRLPPWRYIKAPKPDGHWAISAPTAA